MSQMVYKFKPGSRFGGDAQVVGQELERIREENGGLTASVTVEAAKREDSPLHRYFEWRDNIAAEQYRLNQARHVIASVTVAWIDEDTGKKTTPVRMFHALDNADNSRYLPVTIVLADKAMRTKLLEQALSEAESFKKKYSDLLELSRIFKAIDETIKIAA
jgi:hypothetical protein